MKWWILKSLLRDADNQWVYNTGIKYYSVFWAKYVTQLYPSDHEELHYIQWLKRFFVAICYVLWKIKANVYSMGKLFVVQPSGKEFVFSCNGCSIFRKHFLFFLAKIYMLRILKLFFHFFRALIGSLCNAAVNICTYSLQFMNMVHYTDHWSGCIAQCAINSINTPYTNHKTRGLGRFLFWYTFVNIIINNSIRICSKQYTDGPNSEVNFGLHETVEFLMYQTFIGTFPNSI